MGGDGWVWVVDHKWLPAPEPKPCRWQMADRKTCGRLSVALLHRGRTRRAYHYCEQHLYGRKWSKAPWEYDGVVMALVAADSPAAIRGSVGGDTNGG